MYLLWLHQTINVMKKLFELQEIKVKYRFNHSKIFIDGSEKAANICRQAYALAGANIELKEYAFIVFLNRANEVIGFYKLSEGGITGTIMDPKLAFSVALQCLACGIILCHNHPSGNLKASTSDIAITNKFKEAAKLLDIAFLDHVILTNDSYISLADEGKL